MFCPNCGAQVENGSTFCSNCGAALQQQQPAGNAAAGISGSQQNPNEWMDMEQLNVKGRRKGAALSNHAIYVAFIVLTIGVFIGVIFMFFKRLITGEAAFGQAAGTLLQEASLVFGVPVAGGATIFLIKKLSDKMVLGITLIGKFLKAYLLFIVGAVLLTLMLGPAVFYTEVSAVKKLLILIVYLAVWIVAFRYLHKKRNDET